MSHLFDLRRNRRKKSTGSQIVNAMKVEWSKVWNFYDINFILGAQRGIDPVLGAHDRAIAALLRKVMVAQPPPEVWERIKENAGQIRRTHLTG